jgi:NAD(P)-dependent dehydrogenase (short-subunit alcohol dehydrogenase family)
MGSERDNRAAIVTGGARGIGKGMATALLKAGFSVTITDIREGTLRETSEEFSNLAGAGHLAVVADGRDDDAVANAVTQTVDTFGRIDLLINNAQTSVNGVPMVDQSVEDLMLGVDGGLFASFRYMKLCHPHLKATHGSVINFGSQAGLIGNWGMVGYNIAKEGIRALTRSAAREWGPDDINVNCIIPGMVTPGASAFAERNPEHAEASLAAIPMGRLGDPETEAGALAVFLASPGGHYITGETISIDGGRVLRP